MASGIRLCTVDDVFPHSRREGGNLLNLTILTGRAEATGAVVQVGEPLFVKQDGVFTGHRVRAIEFFQKALDSHRYDAGDEVLIGVDRTDDIKRGAEIWCDHTE